MTRTAGVSPHPRRRTHARASVPRRSATRIPWAATALVFIVLLAALIGWAVLARRFAPQSNTRRAQFDAIVVLGTPADSDGNPTPAMLERMNEGVREYRRGVAAHLIVTGAAAHNEFVEAEVMARVAEALGVPPSAVIEEPHALDTIQNACFSSRILKTHGWRSAEVVSSEAHLPRAAMIFARLASSDRGQNWLEWRTHPTSENLALGDAGSAAAVVETLKTVRYLVWARWAETCNP